MIVVWLLQDTKQPKTSPCPPPPKRKREKGGSRNRWGLRDLIKTDQTPGMACLPARTLQSTSTTLTAIAVQQNKGISCSDHPPSHLQVFASPEAGVHPHHLPLRHRSARPAFLACILGGRRERVNRRKHVQPTSWSAKRAFCCSKSETRLRRSWPHWASRSASWRSRSALRWFRRACCAWRSATLRCRTAHPQPPGPSHTRDL